MLTLLISILSIYFFVLLGVISKIAFKDQIDPKTVTLLSVYFFQPFLTFWGLTKRPFDLSLIQAPFWYLVIVLTLLVTLYIISKLLFGNLKEKAVFTIASLIGNTGNLGIPLGIAVFGEISIPYTTMINIANVFVVYTFGTYFYSRGSFSAKESLLNVIKIPILWAAILAVVVNISAVEIPKNIEESLKMGAYASITIQLMLFGIYLYSVRIKSINWKLTFWVVFIKFIALPLLAFVALFYLPLEPLVKGILFMSLMMPLAVANINLAALYDCLAKEVTALVFLTSVLFLGYFALCLPIFGYWNQ